MRIWDYLTTFKEPTSTVIVAVPVINEVTNNGIITALDLEDVAFLGMTWGAWFKVGMFVALLLLIIERSVSIKNKLRRKDDFSPT